MAVDLFAPLFCVTGGNGDAYECFSIHRESGGWMGKERVLFWSTWIGLI